MFKQAIEVSPEMLSLVGQGRIPSAARPSEPLMMSFSGLDGVGPALVRIDPACELDGVADTPLLFFVAAAACRRIFGFAPAERGTWHLPSDARAMALAITGCASPEPARGTRRLAKSIELLCAVLEGLAEGALVPADGDGVLSAFESARIAAARRLIDERWHEKLTLEAIARACGLNRGKLTSGFKTVYKCTVGDALACRRLDGARALLLSTDLPVSAVGYRCGYNNNASFTRAFSRRYGVAPTRYRVAELAA